MSVPRKLRRILVATAIIGPAALAPEMSSAEGLLDFLFGGSQKQEHQQPPPPARPVLASSGPGFCVRSCDGKYFPLMRGAASPMQMCKAFCPASPTEVFFGSRIEDAYARSGERYADSKNAFAYRNALRALTAPATATIPQAVRHSTSLWTIRFAPVTCSPPMTGSSPIPAHGPALLRA
jgi:hypothetical protein